MIDDEDARRQADATRAVAEVRTSRSTSPRRQRPRLSSAVLIAAGTGLIAVLIVVGVLVGTDHPWLAIGPTAPDRPGSDDGIPVPEVGDVVVAQLADGSPVFVTQPSPGEILVLDAVDPHRPGGIRKLVVFCRSSLMFEDLRHGSTFDQWGNWAFGPAPSGLALYPTEPAEDGRTVRVVGDRGPAPARDAPRGGPGVPQGPACELHEGSDIADWVGHLPPASVPSLDGTAIPSDQWVWASLILAGPVDRLVVCDADGTCGTGPVVVTDLSVHADREVPPTPFVALARSIGDDYLSLVFTPSTMLLPPDAPWHPFDLVRFE